MSAYKITILELVAQCGYPSNVRDLIATTILEVVTCIKGSKFFKFTLGNENLIAMRVPLSAQFNGSNFSIQIMIYFQKTFPFSQPEIYVEKTSEDMGINPNNKNIDPKSGKIMTNGLLSWNSYSSLINIIKEINFCFNQVFPVYQNKPKQPQISPPSKPIYSPQSNTYSNVSTSQDYSKCSDGFKNLQNETPQNVNEIVKQILIDDIKRKLHSPISNELSQLHTERENLFNCKNIFTNEIKKYQSSKEIFNKLEKSFKFTIEKLNIQYNMILEELDKNKDKVISRNDYMDLVRVEDEKLLKLISIEACLEDVISIVKKAFIREAVSFGECVKLIRISTREVLKVRLAREVYLRRSARTWAGAWVSTTLRFVSCAFFW